MIYRNTIYIKYFVLTGYRFLRIIDYTTDASYLLTLLKLLRERSIESENQIIVRYIASWSFNGGIITCVYNYLKQTSVIVNQNVTYITSKAMNQYKITSFTSKRLNEFLFYISRNNL